MMNPDIEAYLNGALQGEALKQFEDALARDPALREEVEMLRPLLRDLRRMGIGRRVEAAGRNRTARRWVRRIMVLLCSVLVVAAVWWWGLQGQDKPSLPAVKTPVNPSHQAAPSPALPDTSGEKSKLPVAGSPSNGLKTATKGAQYLAIATRHYEIPSEYAGTRNTQPRDSLSAAKIAFLDKKYADAWQMLGNDTAGVLTETRYLKGHILFAQKQFERSSEVFDALAANPASAYRDAAEWYALLATIAQGKIAGTRLQKILADEKHAYREKAEKLANDLENANNN